MIVHATAPDAEAFAPFGVFLHPPDQAGVRQMYSEWFTPVPQRHLQVHTNLVPPATVPVRVDCVERHPHAAQAFVPLDTGRYLVVVMPATESGEPDPSGARAFVMPPTLGVLYRPHVWHAGITALDRPSSFTVLMWRGAPDDDVFAAITPLVVHA